MLALATSSALVPVASAQAETVPLTLDGPPVIIANGWSPPDVGAAAPLAGRLGAPVLYASRDNLGRPTAEALTQLAPPRVILMGGVAALSVNVETEMRQLLPGVNVERLSGTDRIDTAAKANAVKPAGTWPVVLANGWSPSDVGAAAPYAAALGGSVLFTRQSALGDATAQELHRLRSNGDNRVFDTSHLTFEPTVAGPVYIVGGTAAVGSSVTTELWHSSGDTGVRIGGADRVATAAALALQVAADRPYAPVVLANGWSTEDVGIAAPYAAAIDGIVLFTYPGRLGDATAEALRRLQAREVVIIGNAETLPVSIETELAEQFPDMWSMRFAGADRIERAARAALDETLRPSLVPVTTIGRRLASGGRNTCGILANLMVHCWGNDHVSGVLDTPYGRVPTPMWYSPDAEPFYRELDRLGGGFVDIGVGEEMACGLLLDQTVACWGGYAPAGGRFLDLWVGSAGACGHRAYGNVLCWGPSRPSMSDPFNAPQGRFSKISIGGKHACGVRADQTIACWGSNDNGQADHPSDRFLSVSAGRTHTCGVRMDQTVACWGSNSSRQIDHPTGRFVAVSAGGDHTCGLRIDQTVACWGWGGRGQIDAPPGRFAHVTLGELALTCGLRLDRTAECWGELGSEAPPGEFSELTVAGFSACGLRPDQTVECWGGPGHAPPVASPALRFLGDAPTSGIESVLPPHEPECRPSTDAVGKPGPPSDPHIAFLGAVTRYGDSRHTIGVRWGPPCSGGPVDRYVVQWRAPHQGWSDARQRVVESFDTNTPFFALVPSGYFAGFASGGATGVYAVRVVAVNLAGVARSDEVIISNPTNDTRAVLHAIVETFGDRYPWLTDIYRAYNDGPDHIAQSSVSNSSCTHRGAAGEASGGSFKVCGWLGDRRDPGGAGPSSIAHGRSGFGQGNTIVHELAHTYETFAGHSSSYFKTHDRRSVPATSSSLAMTPEARASVAAGLIYLHEFATDNVGPSYGSHCPTGELFADVPAYLFAWDGLEGRFITSDGRMVLPEAWYWQLCSLSPTEEARQVFVDVFARQRVPQWFYGRFVSDDDSWDLGALRAVLRNQHHKGDQAKISEFPQYRMLRTFLLESRHGGYCSEQQVDEFLDGKSDTPPDRHENGGCAAFKTHTSGERHSCALRSDDTVACWGDNRYGQSEAPSGTFSAVSVGLLHSCALRSDDTIACWGYDDERTTPPSGSFTSVKAANQYSCALRTIQSIACWGTSQASHSGQLLDPPNGAFSEIVVGGGHACALRTNRSVACWGSNTHGQANAPSGAFSAVTAGRDHSCGLRAEGTIDCWGSNAHGQIDSPAGTFAAISVASPDPSGHGFSCAIRTDQSIACWGTYGPYSHTPRRLAAEMPSGVFTKIAISRATACGLRPAGRIECWGAAPSGAVDFALGRFVDVTVGSDFVCGRRSDGTIACWSDKLDAPQVQPPACRDRPSAPWRSCSRVYSDS